jgi:hypothetical protein
MTNEIRAKNAAAALVTSQVVLLIVQLYTMLTTENKAVGNRLFCQPDRIQILLFHHIPVGTWSFSSTSGGCCSSAFLFFSFDSAVFKNPDTCSRLRRWLSRNLSMARYLDPPCLMYVRKAFAVL